MRIGGRELSGSEESAPRAPAGAPFWETRLLSLPGESSFIVRFAIRVNLKGTVQPTKLAIRNLNSRGARSINDSSIFRPAPPPRKDAGNPDVYPFELPGDLDILGLRLIYELALKYASSKRWRKVRDSNPGESFNSAGFPYYYSFRYQASARLLSGLCLHHSSKEP